MNYLYPENPNVKKYIKDLKDIEFPVILKLCFEKENEDEILQAFGYNFITQIELCLTTDKTGKPDFFQNKSMKGTEVISIYCLGTR